VNRGGSWNNSAPRLRAAYRNHDHPGNRRQNLGVRLARAPRWRGCAAADPIPSPTLGLTTPGSIPRARVCP
jgi:hypothetical protein